MNIDTALEIMWGGRHTNPQPKLKPAVNLVRNPGIFGPAQIPIEQALGICPPAEPEEVQE